MSVGFIIPLKAKKISNDWALTSELLNETLNSLRNQTDQNFHVVVVGHDVPVLSDENNKIVDFLKCTFELPVKKEHVGNVTHVKHIYRIHDKFQKIAEGLIYLDQHYHCTYYMSLDADDLLNKRVVDYVLKKQNPNGYLLNKGVEFFANRNQVIYNDNMISVCGSTFIIHRNHVLIPERLDYEYLIKNRFPFFISHKNVKVKCEDANIPLENMPFVSILYKLGHGQNVSNEFRQGFVKGVKLTLKLMLKGKPLTKKVKNDFAITE